MLPNKLCIILSRLTCICFIIVLTQAATFPVRVHLWRCSQNCLLQEAVIRLHKFLNALLDTSSSDYLRFFEVAMSSKEMHTDMVQHHSRLEITVSFGLHTN